MLEAKIGQWLVKEEQNGEKLFAKIVYAASSAEELLWHDCTDEDKQEYEKEHSLNLDKNGIE